MYQELNAVVMPNGSLQMEWAGAGEQTDKGRRLLQQEIYGRIIEDNDLSSVFGIDLEEQVAAIGHNTSDSIPADEKSKTAAVPARRKPAVKKMLKKEKTKKAGKKTSGKVLPGNAKKRKAVVKGKKTGTKKGGKRAVKTRVGQ